MLFLVIFVCNFFYAADELSGYELLKYYGEGTAFFHKYLFVSQNNSNPRTFNFSRDEGPFVSSCDFRYSNDRWQGVVTYTQNGIKSTDFFVAQKNTDFQDHEFLLRCDCDDDNNIECGYCIKFKSFFNRKKVKYLGYNVALYTPKKRPKELHYYDSSNILKKQNWKVSFIDIKNALGIRNSQIVFQDPSNQTLAYDLVDERISGFMIKDEPIVCKNAFYCGNNSLIDVLNENEIYFKRYDVNGDVKEELLFNNINKRLTSVDRHSDGWIELKFLFFSLFYNPLTEKKGYRGFNGFKDLEQLFKEKYGWSESDGKYAIDPAGNIKAKQKNSTFVAFPLYTSFFKRIIFKKILYGDGYAVHLEVDNDERLFCFDTVEKKFYVNPKKITYDPINISWIFNPYNFEKFVPESLLYRKWLNLKQKCIAAKITVQNYCNRKIDSFMTYIFSFLEKIINKSNMPSKDKLMLLSLLKIYKA